MSALCCYLDSSGTELIRGGLYSLSVLSQGSSWPGLWLNFQGAQQPKEVPAVSQVLIHQQTSTSAFLNWHYHLLEGTRAAFCWALFIKISWNLLPFPNRKHFSLISAQRFCVCVEKSMMSSWKPLVWTFIWGLTGFFMPSPSDDFQKSKAEDLGTPWRPWA